MPASLPSFAKANFVSLHFPALIIFVTVLAFNLFGDGLRDTLDPKIK
jgi:ABC-type dipeptide/oligopeptide/nickel transport system permease subunit